MITSTLSLLLFSSLVANSLVQEDHEHGVHSHQPRPDTQPDPVLVPAFRLTPPATTTRRTTHHRHSHTHDFSLPLPGSHHHSSHHDMDDDEDDDYVEVFETYETVSHTYYEQTESGESGDYEKMVVDREDETGMDDEEGDSTNEGLRSSAAEKGHSYKTLFMLLFTMAAVVLML